MRGAPTAGSLPQLGRTSSFHYDPVYDGISLRAVGSTSQRPLRSNTQIHMGCRAVFLVFLFAQGLCWKLVTGPAWIAISPVPSLMASSSTDQLPFLFPLRLLKEFVPLPYCLVWQNIKVAYLWISGRQFCDIFQLKKRAILVSCTIARSMSRLNSAAP